MATLQAIHKISDPSYADWQGLTNVVYEYFYDPVKNQTTITFQEGFFQYYGLKGYVTTAKATINVVAEDDPDETVVAVMEYKGATTGGTSKKTSTPVPSTVIVNHSISGGEKSIKISVSSAISVYITSARKSEVKAEAFDIVPVGVRKGIIYVGEKVGKIVIYNEGSWKPGSLLVGMDSDWHLGTGNIFDSQNNDNPTYFVDENENYLSDENGNYLICEKSQKGGAV